MHGWTDAPTFYETEAIAYCRNPDQAVVWCQEGLLTDLSRSGERFASNLVLGRALLWVL